MRNRVMRFGGDSPMYLILSNQIIEEVAFMYETRYQDVVMFMYCYLINHYVLKKEWYDFVKTSNLLTAMNIEMKHTPVTLKKLFEKLHERGLVSKMGSKYIVDSQDNKIYYALKYMFSNRIDMFHKATYDPAMFGLKLQKQKRFKKRRVGRPKKGTKYSCRVPYISKTNKLYK